MQMPWIWLKAATMVMILWSQGANGVELGSSTLLESAEFERMKLRYQRCVLSKGRKMLDMASFAETVELAPLACHRDLLKIKQFMLNSAFKSNVMDDLLAAIAEGVKIDLVNSLLEQTLREES